MSIASALSGSAKRIRQSFSSQSFDEIVLPLLGLLAVGLAVALVRDFGNQFGADEWAEVYTVNAGSLSYTTDRVLDMLPHWSSFHIVGIRGIPTHVFAVALRITSAWFIFLLVLLAARRNRGFAFAVATVFLAYDIRDWFATQEFYAMHLVGTLFLGLLALTLMAVALKWKSWLLLISACLVSVVSIFSYDAAAPVLLAVAVGMYFAVSERSTIGRTMLVVFLMAVVTPFLIYNLALFSPESSAYRTGIVTDIRLKDLIWAAQRQYQVAFRHLFLPELSNLHRYLLPIFLTSIAIVLVWNIMPRQEPSSQTITLKGSLLWVLAGLALCGAGFVLYLPTYIARWPARGHIFSAPGTALTITALIWTATTVFRSPTLRDALRMLLVLAAAASGLSTSAAVQEDVYRWGGAWESQALALRSLSHQMPAVKDNTLVVLIEDPDVIDAPFDSGFAFQFAIRYLYQDSAVGLVFNETLLAHTWEVTNEGIRIESVPPDNTWVGARTSSHRWDEIIAVTKLPDGRMVILDELPQEIYTPGRAEQYAPYVRISNAFVPLRIQTLFPPIQVPTPQDQ